jgi:hypothetical protein
MELPPYLRSLLADPLFLRVCMALWSAPFLALGIFAGIEWRPEAAWEWVGFGFVALIGVYGAYLLYTAFLGSGKRLEKATDWLADGGDIMGAVFALLVAGLAIPITIMLRAALDRRQ